MAKLKVVDDEIDDEYEAVVVISFKIPRGKTSLEDFQMVLHELKPIFKDKPGLKVYGATENVASLVINVLEEGKNV